MLFVSIESNWHSQSGLAHTQLGCTNNINKKQRGTELHELRWVKHVRNHYSHKKGNYILNVLTNPHFRKRLRCFLHVPTGSNLTSFSMCSFCLMVHRESFIGFILSDS